MRILITGAKGFTGKSLINHLKKEAAIEIFTSDLNFYSDENYLQVDLSIETQVVKLISQVKPDIIYHLAGTTTNQFEKDYIANVLATRNILQAVLESKSRIRVLLIGSAAEYGFVTPEQNPVKEEYPLNPVSIYGLTKVYQTGLMKFYVQNYGLDIVMVRTFNLLGEGLSDNLFIGRLYKQISEYKAGILNKIVLGNLNSKRDYIDVDDAIKKYQIVMNKGKSGEVYNIGSGKSILIRDLLDIILNKNNLDFSIIETREIQTPGKFDIPDIYADISKISDLI